jgi:Flp pilus assembly protein TadD
MAIQAKVVVRKVWPYGLLVGLCVLAFWPMFRNGFVWDDQFFIVKNQSLLGLWPPSRFFPPQASVATGTLQRPVMAFSLALDYALWKFNPFGYHLTNLFLHLLCVFGVSWLTFWLSRSRGAAFLAGALFTLLPGHAEGVIAFLGRSDLLATLFVLLGLWAYIRHLSVQGWRRTFLFLGSLAAYLFACFSKESGIILLGILVIYEGFVSGKAAGEWKRKALRLIPFLLVAMFYWWYRGNVLGGEAAGSRWWGGSAGKNFLMMFEVYARYLRLLVFPLSLSIQHRVPIPGGFWDGGVLRGAALLLGSVAGTAWALWKHPRTGFLASWFLLGLIPVANLIPIPGAMMLAERWLYLPSVGACALLGWGAWRLYLRAQGWVRGVWLVLVILVLALFAFRTFTWAPVWRNEESVFQAMAAAAPDEAVNYNNLGNALLAKGEVEEAIANYLKALKIKPNYPEAHNNLGSALGQQGKLNEAETEFREAIRLSPDFAEPHSNLGSVLLQQGNVAEAEKEYREAVRLNPGLAKAHDLLRSRLLQQGKLSEAEREYQEALRLNPDDAEAHRNLTLALRPQGKLNEVGKESREALRLKPGDAEAHNNLGNALLQQGKLAEAEKEYREALRMKPDYADAHINLGIALCRQGKLKEGEQEYREAIRLAPDYAVAYYNLAVGLIHQGRKAEAIEALKAFLARGGQPRSQAEALLRKLEGK